MRWLAALGLAALGLAACGDGGARRGGQPPRDVLLLTVEGLRADRLNAAGYPRPTTYLPVSAEERASGRELSIDGLVGRGVSFAGAYTASSRLPAALGTLLTGAPPLESCRFEPADFEGLGPGATLADRFRAAGFRTAAFPAGLALAAGAGLGLGFETVGGPEAVATDESVLREAALWLEERSADERTLLWIHLQGPVGGSASGAPLDPRRYDADLAATGQRIAGFLGRLAGSGRLERTVVVLTSPGGARLRGHGLEGDGEEELDEGPLHVPLVLCHPQSLTGRRRFGGIVGLDRVQPTLLDWFELAPAPVRGSLLPWVDGDAPPRADLALSVAEAGAVSLRSERWRIVVDVTRPEEHVALYEVDRGSGRTRDVATERPELLREARHRLELVLETAGPCVPVALPAALAHLVGAAR